MNSHDLNESPPEAAKLRENVFDAPPASGDNNGLAADVEQAVRLGEQIIGFLTGTLDLARLEMMLAVRTVPRLVMVWLLMMPVILLAWCSFSALTAWAVFEVSEEVGLGIFTFFLQQLLLLLSCRWLFVKYRQRMTLPYTRAQIDTLMRSVRHGVNSSSETKK